MIRVGDIKLGAEEKEKVMDILNTGMISEGKNVREFEDRWANYIGTKYCIATNSGSSAILAGLHALLYDDRFPKIKKGSKVITSPVSYVATSNAIVLAGMEPVYVDICPDTFTLTVDQIEDLVSRDPDAYSIILPVHLMGYPNNMDAINDLARKYDLVVFEDASQAHGSTYKGKKVGSLSLLASYSFYIAHNIQAGELGAIVTSDDVLRRRIKQIKANGRICGCRKCSRIEDGHCIEERESFDPKFTHLYIGFNFKASEFHTAIAIPQIERADEIVWTRLRNVGNLNSMLDKYSSYISLPPYFDSVSYFAYPIICESMHERHGLMRKLNSAGIETRPLFGCIPIQQPAYSHLKSRYQNILPNADHVGVSGFYIGCHQYLTAGNKTYIVSVFKEYYS